MSGVSETLERQRVDLMRLLRRYGVSVDLARKVYCEGAQVSEKVLSKLVKLESSIADELGARRPSELIESILCRGDEAEISSSREAEAIKTEVIVEVPIYAQGGSKMIKIIRSEDKVMIESDVNVCREPEDLLLGSTSLYVKCNGTWTSFVHGLEHNDVVRLRALLSVKGGRPEASKIKAESEE